MYNITVMGYDESGEQKQLMHFNSLTIPQKGDTVTKVDYEGNQVSYIIKDTEFFIQGNAVEEVVLTIV